MQITFDTEVKALEKTDLCLSIVMRLILLLLEKMQVLWYDPQDSISYVDGLALLRSILYL